MEKKTLFLSSFVCLLFTSICISFFVLRKNTPVVLNVYNAGEYISTKNDGKPDVNDMFTKETGIRVNYTTFQSNEEMLAKILGGGADYDVICPSDYTISKLIKKDALHEINFENIPNYRLVDDSLKNLSFDPLNKYSVPYLWGTIGIFYDYEALIDEEDISWGLLWDKKYSKKILMFDNPRDAFAVSMIRNGKSVNSVDKNEWIEAFKDLQNQIPVVQNYMSDQIYDKLVGREAYLAPYYNGYKVPDILKDNDRIRFAIPKEGTVRFVDSMCILKDSKHKKEAEQYINFLCKYEISLLNARATGNLPANKMAIETLSEENTIKNLDKIKKSEIFKDLPPEITKMNDSLWMKIKAGEEDSKIYNWVLIFILLLLIMLAFVRVKGRKFNFWSN